jgi:TrmH family RNA methyltransferase
VFANGTVDPYNPKTVRSSAGSIFHVPLVVCGPEADVLAAVSGYRSLGAVVRGGTSYTAVDWLVPTALVLGNEAAGLAPEVTARLDGTVGIPMAGRAESLNVGVACAVLCFEALRQRRAAGVAGSSMPDMPGSSR